MGVLVIGGTRTVSRCGVRRVLLRLGAVVLGALGLFGIWIGTAFADAPLSWSAPEAIDPGLVLQAMSCPSVSLCVGVDNDGNVVTSTDPAGGAGTWTVTDVDNTVALLGVSCPSTSLCVGVDIRGNVVTSTDPTGGAGAWTVANVDGTIAFNGVSCPSSSLCVAVDSGGDAVSSTDPTGGVGAWTVADVDSTHFLNGVACASSSLCVAVDGSGNVVTSTNPSGGAGAWTAAHVDGTNAVTGVSCPSSSFCAATDSAGDVVTSTDPTGGAGAWTVATVDASQYLYGLSCASASLCVAVDGTGRVATTTNPTGGSVAWTVADIDSTNTIYGVSCPSSSLCVAGDTDGNALIGTSQHTLTVSLSGAGAGTVSGAGIACPGTCSNSDLDGTSVTLTATPAAGSTFAGWSGGGCSGTAVCQVTMSSDQNVTATFNRPAGPTATGELTISPTPVYSNLTAACGGAAWSVPAVTTQWLLDGLPIPGATATTLAPPIRDDGHQLTCSENATAGGVSATVTSAPTIVYERPPVPAGDPDCSGPPLCIFDAAALGVGSAYPHNGDWWTADPVECLSGGWTSANGNSQLAGIRGLLEAHTVRISLERVNGATTTVLVSEDVTNLGTVRDPEQGYLPSADIAFSYGLQKLIPAESSLYAGLSDPGAPGQGYFAYFVGLGRTFELTYNLTAADIGTHMRCVTGADDGPLAHPTSGVSTTDFVVANNPECAPRFLNSGSVGGPIIALRPDVVCVKATGQLQQQATPLPISVPVTGGTVALPISCALPGGCHGTLSLVNIAAAGVASTKARSSQVLGTERISLRGRSERALHILLTARGRRLVRGAKHGLLVVLRLKNSGHTRTVASLRLMRRRS